ncbi:MAG: uroporphyrinogen decarboxylase family protein [Sideroxyarcus sp.]
MLDEVIENYNAAVLDTDRARALQVVADAVEHGVSPEDIVFKVVIPGMDMMVKALSEGFDTNLAQHFMTSQIAADVTEKMLLQFKSPPKIVGTVVIGTAAGDLHTLGKRIVIGCLKAQMIDVTDLGVNVPAERFVDEAVARGAQVIGVSTMMVHTARGENGPLKVRKILRERGLERKIKLVVGGAPYRYDPNLYKLVQADAWAENGVTASKVIMDCIAEVKAITSMDRLVAAANGRLLDHIPVFCNLLDQGARELGISIEEYFSKGENVAEAQLRMLKKFGHDNVWSLFYVGKEAELFGCKKIRFAKDGPPNVEDYVIKSYDDIVNLQVPDDISTHPAFAETAKCLAILKREVGGKVPICAYLTASMSLPALLMSMEKWLELLMIGDPAVRDMLLEKCSDFFRKEIEAYRKAGADVLVYADPYGSTDIIPMRLFKELSLKWIKRDLEPGGLNGVVYYVGGARLNTVADEVIREVGISVFYPGPLDDIAESMRIIKDRALCAAVINDIKLLDWTPDEVRTEVQRIVQSGLKVGKKLFFGTVVMPYGIPEENIKAMIDAAKEYGRG